jgi:cytochrome P450
METPGRAERPQCLPVTVGRLLDFPDDPAACMQRLYRAHGNIAALEEANQRVVFVFGPHYNHQVLSDAQRFHARFFAIRGPQNSAQRRLTAGLLSMNGEQHKRHRRLVSGPFQKAAIGKYQQGLTELAQGMVREWRPGEVRDIASDMKRYMLRVTSSLLFGFDLHELAYEIGHMIDRWVGMNHELGIGAFVADPRITHAYQHLLLLAEELEAQVRKMIELRRSSLPGEDVLSLLIRARDERGTGMTDDELIGQATVLFGAAHMTTAHTLSWSLFLLAQHPGVAADLVDELNGVLKGDTPTFEQLDQLPLLDRTVKESMRLLPASAYSQRICAEAVELGPFSLPRGTPVVFSPLISHRIPELYEQPERFEPQRWEWMSPGPYEYIPFAAGPRLCLGAAMAMMTIKTTLPTILQRHRLAVMPGATINGKVLSTMLAPTSGIPMLILPRSAPFAASPVQGNINELVAFPGSEGVSPFQSRAA